MSNLNMMLGPVYTGLGFDNSMQRKKKVMDQFLYEYFFQAVD